MKIVKIILRIIIALIGVLVILSALQSLTGLREITNTAEKAGYITGCALFVGLGIWMISQPFKKKKRTGEPK